MKYYFFVTNVKTQTFYRIVQFFFSLLFGKEGGSHLSTCVVFRIVPAYVVVLLSFQMKIYMNIYEDNTSLKLQVWLRYLSSTYYNFFKCRYVCLLHAFFFLAFLLHFIDSLLSLPSLLNHNVQSRPWVVFSSPFRQWYFMYCKSDLLGAFKKEKKKKKKLHLFV